MKDFEADDFEYTYTEKWMTDPATFCYLPQIKIDNLEFRIDYDDVDWTKLYFGYINGRWEIFNEKDVYRYIRKKKLEKLNL